MPLVVNEPGRTFFHLFFPIGSSWARAILPLTPRPGPSHASWNCLTEFCSPNYEPQWFIGKLLVSLANGSVCPWGLWETTLPDRLQVLAHFLILAWIGGQKGRGETP